MKRLLKQFSGLVTFLLFSSMLSAQVYFTANPYNGCAPLSVQFTYSGDPQAVIFEWDFGDGQFSNERDPLHVFYKSGPYWVQLKAYDSKYNFKGSFQRNISVYGGASISINPSKTVCPNEQVNFCYNSNFYSINWDFGDGQSNTWNCTQHSYSNPGNYIITCTVNTFDCGEITIRDTITVTNSAIPNVSINSSNTYSCPNDEIYLSTNYYNAKSYSWDFGNGNYSTEKNPVTKYNAYGNYKVIATVTNICNNTNSDTTEINIINQTFVNANFGFWPGNPCPLQQVNFSAWGSGYFIWDFGDGNTSMFREPRHSYAAPGNYTVKLIVVNGCGYSDTATQNIVVQQSGNAYINAAFTFENENDETNNIMVCPGETVKFRDRTEGDWDNRIYLWNFGDGTTSNERNPSHVFTNTGANIVSLIVLSACGGGDTAETKTVFVNPTTLPKVSLTNTPDTICPGEMIYFADQNYENENNYIYNIWFGDGDSAKNITTVNPLFRTQAIHKYNTEGTYVYQFSATNQCNNTVTHSNTIVVTNAPHTPLSYVSNTTNPNQGRLPAMWNDFSNPPDTGAYTVFNIPLTFEDWEEGLNPNLLVAFWYASGGQPFESDPQGIVVKPNGPGMVTAYVPLSKTPEDAIFIIGAWWCNTFEDEPDAFGVLNGKWPPQQMIYYPLVAGDTVTLEGKGLEFIGWDGNCESKNAVCPGDPVQFVAAGGVSYSWSFGDGNTSTLQNPKHTYAEPGEYKATVIITNACNNKDTVNTNVSINEYNLPSANFWYKNNSCYGEPVKFFLENYSNYLAPEYTYLWEFGDGSTSNVPQPVHTYNFEGQNQSFEVKLTVTNGCGSVTNSHSVWVNKFTVDSRIVKPCASQNNGKIFLNCNGYDSFSYTWSNSATTQNIYNLSAGTYSVTVSSTDGCSVTQSFNITESDELTISELIEKPLCFGQNTGSINAIVTGGTLPYIYKWSNNENQSYINHLAAGNYTVTVTDINGCSISKTVELTQPTQLTGTFNVTNVSCTYGNNGAIDFTPTGGTLPYTYYWSNEQISQDLNWLQAGYYSVMLTDKNGCNWFNGTEITQPEMLYVEGLVNNTVCSGKATGNINLNVFGGIPQYSYSWSNGRTTKDISNLLSGNYTVTVIDANGCNVSQQFNVGDGYSISVYTTIQDVQCNGSSNGFINLNVEVAQEPITYLWSNSSTTQNINSLSGGTYTVTVTDKNNCSIVHSETINEPTLLTTSLFETNVLCNGANTGAIDLVVNGGTYPYQYTWSIGGPNKYNEDINQLYAGTYSVTVKDNNNCTATASIEITEPSEITVSANVTNVSCTGYMNGSIDITVSGGTPNYLFLWNTNEISQNIAMLAPGNYTVTITDRNNCQKTHTETIEQPEALELKLNVTNTTCQNSSDGEIQLDVNNGTSPYSYNWSNSATTQNITGIPVGTYSVTVTDNNGCTIANTASVIAQIASVTFNADITNTACGDAEGTITIKDIVGGTTPYEYIWSNTETTNEISNLPAGLYSITVTSSEGCSGTATYAVNNTSGPSIDAITTTSVSCFGLANGSATISVSGGTTPYTYSWSGGSDSTSQINLAAGTHYVSVTDDNGCLQIQSFSIGQPTNLSISFSKTNVSCNSGNTGSIEAIVTGGTTEYAYSWSNDETTQTISSLSSGTYTLTVTDANLCTKTASTTITQPTALTSSKTIINARCFSQNSGMIDITPSGGILPYNYTWSNGQASQDAINLNAGTYTVTIIDSKGCTLEVSGTVSEPDNLVLSESITPVVCNGQNNGSITVTPQGGTGAYTYLWSNYATTATISNLASANYNITVTDANNCSVNTTYNVPQPAIIQINTFIDNINCFGEATGSITANVIGGTTPYTYLWNTSGTENIITDLTAGEYTITVTDANNCTKSTKTTVFENSKLNSNISKQNVSCFKENDGTASLSVWGGTNPYTYNWSNANTDDEINNLTEGKYKVTITDDLGCTLIDSVYISEPTEIIASFDIINISCNGGNNGRIDLTVSGGTPNYGYSWSTGQWIQDIVNLSSGTYTVTITDSRSCVKTFSTTLTEPDVISVSANISNLTCFNSKNGAITITPSGGTTPYSFKWSNLSTTQNITNLNIGTYTVTITDNNGCSKISSYTITQPTLLTITKNKQNVTCNGQSTGMAWVSVSGGTPLYTYAWSNLSDNDTITNLTSGKYYITVTDANNCSLKDSIAISQPQPIAISLLSKLNVSCNGLTNGQLNVTATGGTGPFQYNIGLGNQNNGLFTNLSANDYTITVTDANSCTTIETYSITEPTELTANITGTNLACNAVCNGSATALAGGGITPYTYLWSTTATTSAINKLCANQEFRVTITDANSCTTVDNITLTEPDALAINIATNQATCGNSDGSATATVTGGVTPYTYLWNDASNQTTAIATALVAGTYKVTVTDGNGCKKDRTTIINNIGAPTINTSITNVSCNGDNNGAATAIAIGGTSPYTYSWSNGDNDANATNLEAGTYHISVTDNNNCLAVASVTITEPYAISVITSKEDDENSTCAGTATITVSGGTTPYTYLWNDASNQTTATAIGLCAGNYKVTVTDANGCTYTQAFLIDNVTNIATLIANRMMNVYPNPNNTGMFTIELSDNNFKKATVKVMDLTGKVIYVNETANNIMIQLNLNNIAAGMYYLEVSIDNKQKFNSKLVITGKL